MSDIVERLRDPKVYIPGEELLHEAADEITALRAEVEKLRAARDSVLEQAEEAIKETKTKSRAIAAIRALKSKTGDTP